MKTIAKALATGVVAVSVISGAVITCDVAHISVTGSHSTTYSSTKTSTDVMSKTTCDSLPKTASAYSHAFSHMGPNWLAADVSISVKMSKNQYVWLFGDTFSYSHQMVNSSAVVQCGSKFHVSNEGRQLLPKAPYTGNRKNVYWIESAQKISNNTIQALVSQESVGQDNSLDFHRTNPTLDKVAILKVTSRGNVKFSRWGGYMRRPKLDTHFLTVKDGAPFQKAGYLFYGKIEHKDIPLTNGKHLQTICRNRIGGSPLDHPSQFLPVFSAVS